jgi:hydroxyacylglutathione hydrolase
MMNKKGYDELEELISKNLKGLQPDQFLKKASEENTIILDTRDAKDAMKSYIKGSIILPLNINYAIWAATLFKPDTKFLLVTEKGNEREAMIRLARVGYNNTIGYLNGGIDLFTGKDLTSLAPVDDYSKLNLIDVREKGEYESEGVIEKAKLVPLSTIFNNIEEIRAMKTPIGVYCKSGARSTIAGSILNKYNIRDVYANVGFKKLIEKGAKVIKYIKI